MGFGINKKFMVFEKHTMRSEESSYLSYLYYERDRIASFSYLDLQILSAGAEIAGRDQHPTDFFSSSLKYLKPLP